MWQDYWHCSTNWLGKVFKKLFIWTLHHKRWVFIDSKVPHRNKGRWPWLCIALFEWVHSTPLWPKTSSLLLTVTRCSRSERAHCDHKSAFRDIRHQKTQETQHFWHVVTVNFLTNSFWETTQEQYKKFELQGIFFFNFSRAVPRFFFHFFFFGWWIAGSLCQ